MKLLKEISRKKFREQFGTKELCLKHLANQKWSGGYLCRKCSGESYIQGKQPHSRRCKMYSYDESPTAHTFFHKLKFGTDDAFEMLHDIATSKKGASSIWLGERHEVRQTTAWLFRQKAQAAMKSSEKHPLDGEVHVDEFEIGTPKKGEQGRIKSEKKMRVVIALEYRRGKCGRGYARVIEDYSAESLRSIFEDHISPGAKVLADGWTGYKPLKESHRLLRQRLSDKCRNFPMVHNQIRNFKVSPRPTTPL